MNKSLQTKLEQLLDRYEELGALLSDSEVIADQERFRGFSKEYADIEPVVNCYRRFESQTDELEGARQMLNDSDVEIREMAGAEVESLESSLVELDSEMQMLLLHTGPSVT